MVANPKPGDGVANGRGGGLGIGTAMSVVFRCTVG